LALSSVDICTSSNLLHPVSFHLTFERQMASRYFAVCPRAFLPLLQLHISHRRATSRYLTHYRPHHDVMDLIAVATLSFAAKKWDFALPQLLPFFSLLKSFIPVTVRRKWTMPITTLTSLEQYVKSVYIIQRPIEHVKRSEIRYVLTRRVRGNEMSCGFDWIGAPSSSKCCSYPHPPRRAHDGTLSH
jgi:hypothetical protein